MTTENDRDPGRQQQDFAGRVAVLTGATRGIGLAIAAELVRRGASVVVTARKPDELEAAVAELDPDSTGRAISSRGSADDAEHQAFTVALAIERFGRLDHLVNNAAVNPQYGLLMDADLGAVRKVFDVNVTATLAWTQLAWRAWLRDHGGSVLNVASVGGIRAGSPIGAYNASKAALIHLTRQLGVELGPRVRVNAVAPAVVKTSFARALYEDREDEVAADYPLRRLGVPSDIGKAAAFLLSDDASWITGETLVVDGGVTLGG
jgi:3-oxoacyl-[acyl-carrier protein] reductase